MLHRSHTTILASLLALTIVPLVGCGGNDTNQTGASSNEIQDYISANPDKAELAEDGPVSETDEFAAGNQ
ncbi:hypothetical protein K227x_50390 [Rubripirellula lacrimiformis]|uniref:Secreted protein n=1 Tax=Rubripirellula lacrimiformis TaxID=1930273 RepID=A0A517NHK7_9BACT|nr:hypothetical protein [Rubripirellula lacrimiformis]QDT06627.1 hypothetical protein K227x_50390 [Rubripirellula lacrimiformis]